MAQLFPDRPLGSTTSNAERKVFHALKDLLSNDYVVLHHVPVYQKDEPHGRMRDGELDFLVIHPSKGMLVIGVKGGGIARDPVSAKWTSTDANGVCHEIKDPYEQGKNYAFAISKLLQREKSTRNYDYPFFHAAWFPDVITSGAKLGLSDHLHEMTLGKQDLEHAASAIARLFKNCLGGGRSEPGIEGVVAFRKFLAPLWTLTIRLSSSIEEEREMIVEATRSQYKVLSLLQRYRRAMICGPAGSGKTYLAVEKARRIAQQEKGARVLVTCYNSKLAELIRGLVGGEIGIDVYHFHGLCSTFCKEAGIELTSRASGEESSYLFNIELPALLLQALCVLGTRYDAVIVDEGQDFDPSWWPVLEQCLEDPVDGTLYIFCDDNQGIYGRRNDYPVKQEPFVLEENCRNTRRILDAVNDFYDGNSLPIPLGPEGRVPEFISTGPGKDDRKSLECILRKLIREENVDPRDIVILTPCAKGKSSWENGMEVSGFKLYWGTGTYGTQGILCSTIHSFKGLEKPVVIVTEISKSLPEEKRALQYVAYSRANSHLVVIQ